MEFVSVKWLLLLGVLMLWIQMHGYKAAGCFEEERLALLQFKTSLGSDSEEHILPSWVDDPNSDCCEWERVTCNSTTAHVTELSLNNTRLIDDYSNRCYENKWLVNISMFQQIKELKSLDLSYNSIAGSIDKEDLRRLSGMKKLEILNLSSNCFNSRSNIFSSLAAITSLKALIFSSNYMDGSLPIQELSNLENLETLDLSYNNFNITQPIPDFRNLSKLSNLNHLYLSGNDFDGVILNISSMFSSLETLDLSGNGMAYWPLHSQELNKLDNLKVLILTQNGFGYGSNGSILPVLTQSLCGLKRIQHLDLSENNFGGSLPMCLSNLTYLTYLDLSYNNLESGLPMCLSNLTNLIVLDLSSNQFSRKITSSLLTSLISLKYINLSNNLFEGLFSFKSFANCSSLEMVQFISNNDNFKIVTEYPYWIPPFQLRILVFQNCHLQGTPEFLFHQSSLNLINLSHNKIKGSFPNWLLENNTGLEFLFLKNNSFIGEIHLPTASVITCLDISDNNLGGQLQEIEGKKFPKMEVLDLSENHFRGDFPFSPEGDCELSILDLSSNNFTGKISEELVSSCNFMMKLDLSHNNFHGQLFTSQFNLSRLWLLQLNDNQFVRTLSNLVTKFDNLEGLDISNNHFYGEIPTWIVNFTSMAFMSMKNNSFEGPISCSLLSHGYVDLSHNSLYGLLPSCFNLEVQAEHINLQGNRFTGLIPEAFLNASRLLILNLRDNNLSGNILKRFGEFSNLQILSVAGNHLDGFIPKWLCQLKTISLLDLSNNSFSGSIPHCLCNLSFGSKKLEGDVSRFFSMEFSYLQRAYGRIFTEMGQFWYFHWDISQIVTEMGQFSNLYPIGFNTKQEFEFVTKYRDDIYKGDILIYMSGLDISHNDLTGEIPYELGKLFQIHALNLSHNQLSGSIPRSFSKFSQIESLDISYNNLSGEIPKELADLHFLAVFSVAHNNLSGRLPDMKGQFSTFENSSYEGNPFLYGKPLQDCNKDNVSAPLPISPEVENGKWYQIDEVVFLASFSVSFVIFFLGVITLLYVNPYWRQRLFYHTEEFMYSCCYFLYDNLLKFLVHLYH